MMQRRTNGRTERTERRTQAGNGGTQSRCIEDGLIKKGRGVGERAGLETWLHINPTGSLMTEHLENKAQYVSCRGKQEKQHNSCCIVCDEFRLLFVCECLCVDVSLLDHDRGKYCGISRPSYSNQKIKNLLSYQMPPYIWHHQEPRL